MTGSQPIQQGDPMDVELLSVFLPIAHYVLADRNMEARIKRLSIDKEWGTRVFSMATSGELFAELEKLT